MDIKDIKTKIGELRRQNEDNSEISDHEFWKRYIPTSIVGAAPIICITITAEDVLDRCDQASFNMVKAREILMAARANALAENDIKNEEES